MACRHGARLRPAPSARRALPRKVVAAVIAAPAQHSRIRARERHDAPEHHASRRRVVPGGIRCALDHNSAVRGRGHWSARPTRPGSSPRSNRAQQDHHAVPRAPHADRWRGTRQAQKLDRAQPRREASHPRSRSAWTEDFAAVQSTRSVRSPNTSRNGRTPGVEKCAITHGSGERPSDRDASAVAPAAI